MNTPALDEVKTFINGVGFPIVVCLILLYFNLQIAEQQNLVLSNMNKSISESNKETATNRQIAMENGRMLTMLVTEYRKECRP